MKLKTERHTTDVLWVEVPIGRRITTNDFECAMENCVGDWERVVLKDGISVGSEALHEFLDRNDDFDYINKHVVKFLRQVVATEPVPDEYFFHL